MTHRNVPPIQESLTKNLECPICLEMYSCPIFLCENGHSVCGDCHPSCDHCPQCRGEMRDARNYALENIVNDTITRCQHEYEGCDVSMKRSLLDDHEEECQFRKILCTESNKVRCNGAEVPFGYYLEHLVTDHACENADTWFASMDVFESEDHFSWPVKIIEADDVTFLMKMWMDFDYFGIYFVHLGLELDPSKYKVQVVIGHPDDESKRHSIDIFNIENFRILETNPEFFSVKLPKHHVLSWADLQVSEGNGNEAQEEQNHYGDDPEEEDDEWDNVEADDGDFEDEGDRGHQNNNFVDDLYFDDDGEQDEGDFDADEEEEPMDEVEEIDIRDQNSVCQKLVFYAQCIVTLV